MHLQALSLRKNFGRFQALSDVSVDFPAGQIHAVLGENGAGKSTLVKTLFGLLKPDAGQILLDGREVHWPSPHAAIAHGLGMVQQHFTLVDNLSVIDNIMLGAEVCTPLGRLQRSNAILELEKVLPSRALSLPWDKLVGELSVGERQRVEVLKLLFRDAKILFLDEPTAVLAPREIEEFFAILRKLRDDGRTIVLITHKINEVTSLCDTFTVLRQGRSLLHGLVMDYSSDAIVEAMIGRKLAEFAPPTSAKLKNVVLAVKGLRGEGVHDVSLNVQAGEIVGIAGVEGSGQTEFVDLLMGLKAFSGEIKILGQECARLTPKMARELGVGLVPEDRHTQGLWLEESCYTNLALGLEDRFLKLGMFSHKAWTETTASWAEGFSVRADSLATSVRALSGGNQQKIIFAREVVGRKPKFLICHQPTRGVDLGAIDTIHREILRLRSSGISTLLLSSELEELFKLCDRIYVFFNGRISAEFQRSDFDLLRIGAAMTGAANAF